MCHDNTANAKAAKLIPNTAPSKSTLKVEASVLISCPILDYVATGMPRGK